MENIDPACFQAKKLKSDLTKKEGLKPVYLNTVTMAVVVFVFTSLLFWSIEMEVFFVFITLYKEVQIKTEKMSTTKYIPMQNSNGCNEPRINWRFVFFIRQDFSTSLK